MCDPLSLRSGSHSDRTFVASLLNAPDPNTSNDRELVPFIYMCGRYLRRSDKQRIAETFRVGKGLVDLVFPPWDYNVAPTSYQLVIRADRDTRELALMRWGLVPYFAKDLKSFAYSTINARAESLSSSVVFSGPFERRRCLIPADGFYEWVRPESRSCDCPAWSRDRTCRPIGSTLGGQAER